MRLHDCRLADNHRAAPLSLQLPLPSGIRAGGGTRTQHGPPQANTVPFRCRVQYLIGGPCVGRDIVGLIINHEAGRD